MRLNQKLKLLLVISLLITTGLFGLFKGIATAATGQIYISPASTTVQNGKTFTVALRINPGTSVDSVEAVIHYDASKLQFISSAVSTFPTCPSNNGGGGTVTIACTILSGSTSSDSLISSVSFKALAGSGSSPLTLSNANAAYQGHYTDPSVVNGAVYFTTPPAPIATTTKKTTQSPSAAPTPAPTTSAAPVIKPVITSETASIEFSEAAISVKSDIPVKIYLKLGVDPEELTINTKQTELATSHYVEIDPSLILPGTTYYYVVVATDEQGNATTSEVSKFRTKGLTVVAYIVDKNHKPLKNTVIELHSEVMSAKTDDKGIVTFNDVAPGTHHLVIPSSKNTPPQAIVVENKVTKSGTKQIAMTQNVAVVFNFVPNYFPWTGTMAACLLVILVAAFYLLRWRYPGIVVRLNISRYRSRSQTKDVDLAATTLNNQPTTRTNSAPTPGTTVTPQSNGTARPPDETKR